MENSSVVENKQSISLPINRNFVKAIIIHMFKFYLMLVYLIQLLYFYFHIYFNKNDEKNYL